MSIKRNKLSSESKSSQDAQKMMKKSRFILKIKNVTERKVSRKSIRQKALRQLTLTESAIRLRHYFRLRNKLL